MAEIVEFPGEKRQQTPESDLELEERLTRVIQNTIRGCPAKIAHTALINVLVGIDLSSVQGNQIKCFEWIIK